MAAKIKGITIQLGGDTRPLEKSLKDVNKKTTSLQSELKNVERLLKLDPKNTELLAQKQKILGEAVENTKDKLKTLKDAEKQVQKQFKEGKVSEEQYRAIQQEIAATEQNLKGLNTKLDETNNKWKTATDRLDKYGEKAQQIGRTGITYVTVPLVAGAGVAVKYASDLEEALNKTEVAFGSQADAVVDWSKTTLNAYGISQGSALDMVSLFGDMSTSMGLPDDEAAEMSKTLVGLAGDLASFKNIGIDEAETALKSIFTGETESLKNLGVVMTQTNLDAYALAEGYGKTTKDMTEAEKVQLRYAFVLERTSNAQGDFERTGGGTANQMRVMKESSKELAASFGKELLPVITPILKSLNNLLKSFSEMSPETKKVILIIAGIAAAIGPVLLVIGMMASGISSIITLMGIIGPVIGAVAAPVAIAIGAIAALVAIGVLLYKNWDKIKEGASALVEKIKGGFADMKEAIQVKVTEIMEGLKAFPGQMLQIGKDIVGGLINGIKEKFGELKEAVGSIGSTVVSAIKDKLKIKSPSRVMVEMGEYTGEGFSKGLKSSISDIKARANELSSTVTQTVTSKVYHSGSIQLAGVNSKSEFVAASQYIINDMELSRQLRRNKR